MGCHTWFYKPTKLNIEDARKEVIRDLYKMVKLNENIIKFFNDAKIENIQEIINDDGDPDFDFTTKEFYDLATKIFGSVDYISLLDTYPEWDKENAIKSIEVHIRQKRMIEKGLCNCAVYNKYSNSTLGIGFYSKENSSYYDDVDEFHDVFRKYGYPSTNLYSYEETIKYIEDPKNECKIYEYTYKRLKEFWDKYPKGIINFG